MQPIVEKKEQKEAEQSTKLLDQLGTLIEKNEIAYNAALGDFRNQFTLNSQDFDSHLN